MNLILILYFLSLFIYENLTLKKINWRLVRDNVVIRKTIKNVTVPSFYEINKFRIVNGNNVVKIDDFAYQVGLVATFPDWVSMWCGGSLISDRWILTAAHCIDDAMKTVIYLGTTNINVYSSTFKEYQVNRSAYYIHDKFDHEKILNDIALIKLPSPVTFSHGIQPIPLVSHDDSEKTRFDGRPATVSGWGVVSNFVSKDNLQFATILIVDEKTCQDYFGEYVGPTNICQSGDEVKGICPGDSGGPLVSSGSDGRKVLIGVSSFISGYGCETLAPRVATRVSEYLDWITYIIAVNS